MPYPTEIQDILDELSHFQERRDRIEILVSLADQFKGVPPSVAQEPFPIERKIPGCESEVFLWTCLSDGMMHLEFAVQNPQGLSAKALAYILKMGLDGRPPSDAKLLDDDLVFSLFGTELSMGKSLGLTNMIRSVRSQALSLING